MLKYYKILSQLNYIMSSYNPPIENVPIFDSSLFRENNADTSLTITQADKRYLRYPVAQGNETLQGATIQGSLIANSSSTLNGIVNANNDLNVKNVITLQDTTAPATYYTTFTTQSNGNLIVDTNGNGVPTNPSIKLAINNTEWVGLNSSNGFINFTAPSMNINTTNPPICNASSTISTADNSNKIPSTAWVKSVLSTSNSTLAYYRTGLVYGNQKPLATPLVISVNTGSQTGSGITMCPLVFRMTCSYTNATTPASQQDSGGVSTFCNTCSCIFNYFVYNSQPVVSGTNANYFTNGIGNATSNTAYYNNVVYGNTYGRPFWTTALSNEANVAVVFPFTFTGTPFLNGIKTIQFDPPAVGYPATSAFYWEWTIEVINKANFAGMITSTGFDINLNC